MTTDPNVLARLHNHWDVIVKDQHEWWLACAEVRNRHDQLAREWLLAALRGGGLDKSSLKQLLFHADRDLSRKTGDVVHGRYGQTFALHLSNMNWASNGARLSVVSESLRAFYRQEIGLDEALDQQTRMSSFLFVTLGAFLIDPSRYLPWIAAVHEAVATLHPPMPRRMPSAASYRTFLARTHALTGPLEGCPPNMVDQLLYDFS